MKHRDHSRHMIFSPRKICLWMKPLGQGTLRIRFFEESRANNFSIAELFVEVVQKNAQKSVNKLLVSLLVSRFV